MGQVLVNATNISGAGASVLAANLLPALAQTLTDCSITFLLPDLPAFRSLAFPANTRKVFFRRPAGFLNGLHRLRELFLDVPQWARVTNADVCLTLGDLSPVKLPCPEVVFLNQALLLYDDNELAGLRGWPFPKYLYLTKHLMWSLPKVAYVIVQTPVMAERLARKYQVEPQRIVVIPQPVSLHVAEKLKNTNLHARIAECHKPIRLLFLAAHYPHKNHAILSGMIAELQRRGLDHQVQIFVTLDEKHLKPALKMMLIHNPEIITNLGCLPLSEVASALCASTALFLPTLAESYGLIYLESLACGVQILTSDRDFARWMCCDLALYFNPLDPRSIVDAIEELPKFREKMSNRDSLLKRLAEFPKDWNEVAVSFAHILTRLILMKSGAAQL